MSKSWALPSHMYADPQEVLERKQEHELRKSCIGCIHGFKMEFAKGVIANGCSKGKPYGRRCKLYQEVK